MIDIPRNTILTSDEATTGFRELLLGFMRENDIESVDDVSESMQITKNWDLIITCEYGDDVLQVSIPEGDWIPSHNV